MELLSVSIKTIQINTDKCNIGMLNDLVYLHKIIEYDFGRLGLHSRVYGIAYGRNMKTKYNASCDVV